MQAISDQMKTRSSPELLAKLNEAVKLNLPWPSSRVVRRLDIRSISLPSGEIPHPKDIWTRRIKDMREHFHDRAAWQKADKEKVVCITYETYNPEIMYLATEILPGKVGDEYYHTKGHFHARPDAPGIYTCLSGLGVAVLQHKDERMILAPFETGTILFIPPYYAHRVVNIGEESIIYLCIASSDSGWSYNDILLEKGFKYLIVEREGRATFITNPAYERRREE